MADKHRAGRANKSVPHGWPRWRHCSKSADSSSSYARRTILVCPPIPVSSSKTATGAGRSATSPAMPLTSTSKSSACPSTTPCAASPEYKKRPLGQKYDVKKVRNNYFGEAARQRRQFSRISQVIGITRVICKDRKGMIDSIPVHPHARLRSSRQHPNTIETVGRATEGRIHFYGVGAAGGYIACQIVPTGHHQNRIVLHPVTRSRNRAPG